MLFHQLGRDGVSLGALVLVSSRVTPADVVAGLDPLPTGAGLAGHLATAYAYDLNGIKVKSGTTNLLIDPNNPTGYAQVFEESVAGSLTRSYTIGDDVLSQVTSGGTAHHLLYDGHGSTRAISLDTAPTSLAQNYDFDAYGNALGDISAALTPLLYAGEYLASTANQYYLRARHYDTANGRFNRLDPFAGNNSDPQSLHKYAYVHSDPVNNIDPSGRSLVQQLSVTAGWGAIAAILLPAVGQAFAFVTGLIVASVAIYTLLVLLAAGVRELSEHIDKITEALRNLGSQVRRILRRLKKIFKNIYFHYGYRVHSKGMHLLGLVRRTPTSIGPFATRRIYLTGSWARRKLALPHLTPPDAIYIVIPRKGRAFQPKGPFPVLPRFGQPGGGREYRFGPLGSGGPRTVFGPIRITP